MAERIEIPAMLSAGAGRGETEGVLRGERFSDGDRHRRAWLPAAGLGLAALAILPVPIVHLASPLLGIGAIVIAVRRLRQRERWTDAAGRCPHCGASFEAPLDDRHAEPPFWLRCPHCARSIEARPR